MARYINQKEYCPHCSALINTHGLNYKVERCQLCGGKISYREEGPVKGIEWGELLILLKSPNFLRVVLSYGKWILIIVGLLFFLNKYFV